MEGEESVNILKESQGRVRTMAMIHENLYQSPTFSNVPIKEYVIELVSSILYSYGISKDMVHQEFDVEDLKVDIDTALPLGLIINELVTNSMKYAFPQKRGTLKIQFKLRSNDDYQLVVADDGVGLPEDINIETVDSLGLQLVNTLVNQLDGELKIDRSNGTKFQITFKQSKYKKRV